MRPKGSTKNAVQVITRYMCRFCGRQFQNLQEMQTHTQVHFSEKPPHACYVCGRTYRTPSKLQRHVRVHSGERPYACSICGKRFTRSDHVKQHLKVHMPQRQKNVCRLCGMRFMRRQTLQAHLRSHGIVQVFSCNRCGEAFESALQLHHHKETHSNIFYGHSSDGLDAEGGLPISIKREPGEGGEVEESRPILGLAKFGLGPQPDVKEGLDGQVREESNNPAVLAKQALDMALKAQEEPEYSEEKPSQVNGHLGDDDESKSIVIDNDIAEQDDEDVENDNDNDGPSVSISNCFSLAEGENSIADVDLKELEEVKATTFSDGMKMILIPSDIADEDKSEDSNEEADDASDKKDDEDEKKDDDNIQVSSSADVSSSCNRGNRASGHLVSLLPKPPPIIAAPSMRKETLSNQSTSYINMRSLLTATPTQSIRPSRPEPPLLCMGVPGLSSATAGGKSSGYLFGKKMIRCDHCCIWFEDHSMSLLHMSLHSADPSDPFTCRKCLKRLGNRLEFMAHIVWHLDPSMEERLMKS
ncbi:uncharacterized protein [Haliotis cracherodii]|uniref:uncharacterized protein n=1 Tax=Haliotis cracherodii TaxID=6455 RepID=UPI0039E912E4